MRFKLLLISLVLATSLFAVERKVEIIAKQVEHQDDIITATGTAVAVGKGYYIKADKIIYDRVGQVVEAFGNVYILKDSATYIISDYAKVYMNDKTGNFDKFFMQNQIDDVWVSSNYANANQRFYDVNKSITSSCSVENPEWKIKYSKGVYDSEEKQMRLSNAVFYAGNIPLLYSPYISFSTDKTRRTGLLKPEVGYKGDDGLVIAQPIYYVTDPKSNWDSETIPQIRTIRGQGLFETLRFMDSPYSKGSMTLGYFRDTSSYQEEHQLRYSSHYGMSFLYDRKKLFADVSKGEQDGLYADLNYLNDIDYRNLQDFNKNGAFQNTDAIATSKLNYFYQKDSDYFGGYMRYYFDTSKSSNDTTIQQMPKLQYHRYLEPIFDNRLLYSADMKYTKYDRKDGLTANQYQMFVPFTVNFSFFDDYLGLSFSENLYANQASFGGNDATVFNDYSYSSSVHKLKAYTSLVKPFDDFIHTLDAEVVYTKPGVKTEKNNPGTTNDLASQVVSSNEMENASFRLAQFFYDKKGTQILSHRLNQTVYMDTKNVDYKYSDLENEVETKITDKVTLSNDVFYSHKYSRVSTSTTSVTYNDDNDLKLSLSQAYRNVETATSVDRANYLSFGFNKNFAYKYYTFGSYDYDYHLRQERSWSLGLGMKKRCFNYQVSVKRETTPVLTSSGSSSVNNMVIYLSINFVPIGGINQVYSTK